MQEMINKLIEYGYILLFFYSLGGGMLALLAAGVLSSMGSMDLKLCIAIAFISNSLGCVLTYLIGKYYKKDLLPYVRKHRRKLALITLKMRQHDVFLLFTQKYVYGLKSLVPLVAGFSKLNFFRFLILNTLACLLWSLVVGGAGFLAAPFIKKIFTLLATYPLMGPLFLLMILSLLLIYINKFSKK